MTAPLGSKNPCPAEVEQDLLDLGGRNRFGDANWRIVWGEDRMDWICGQWTDRDPHTNSVIREVVENRLVPKYGPPLERWILEQWMAPEKYGTREQWEAQTLEVEGRTNVQALGPYPERGDYEFVHRFENAGGGFLQISPGMARAVLGFLLDELRKYSSAQRRAALMRREEKAEKDYDNRADEILTDALPSFHGEAHVTVPEVKGLWKKSGDLIVPA